MGTERRAVQRKRLVGLSYFQFEAGSGGIVLDASEKGLAFQAAEAIRQPGPHRICISPNPEERIEINGEVVWMDRSKKAGGLRFLELGADAFHRICNWLKQPGASEVSDRFQEHTQHGTAQPEMPNFDGAGQEHYSSCLPPLIEAPLGGGNESGRPMASEPRVTPEAARAPSLLAPDFSWQSQNSHRSGGRSIRIFAVGLLIGAIVAAPIVLFERFRPKVGDPLIRLGEELNGGTTLQSENSPPRPNPVQSSAQGLPAAQSIPQVSDPGEAENPDSAINSPDANKPPNANEGFLAPKKAASQSSSYLSVNQTRERSEQATRLWSAVGSGDSSAEVELARLYLKGEGVRRNCEQAKVLLRAAAKSGSREARQQLQKMRTYGCR